MEISKAELKSAAAAVAEQEDAEASSQAGQQPPEQLRVAEVLVKALQAEGIKQIWGYPGGAVLHIYDALYKQDAIEHILVRHEQAAAHAADAYARSTGEVGVAMVTSGPGVTNALTGLATAYMDSVPMVLISGQVPTGAIGSDAFQECDTVGITRPVVKHNFLVKNPNEIVNVVKKAFHLARTGRPGPVVIDIPKDVSYEKITYIGYPEHVEMRSYNPVTRGHTGQIRRALRLLMSAKRPYIYTGGGIVLANAAPELRALVDVLGFPVTSTLNGLGAMPATDPRFVGMLGMHGLWEANYAMQNADVILALGARFDDRVVGNPRHFAQNPRKIIHVDIDPSSISKRVKADVPIVGDVKIVMQQMLEMLREGDFQPDREALAAWWKTIEGWRAKDCLAYDRSNQDVIKPQYVIEMLSRLTQDADAYITSDVGQHQMWVAQYYQFNEPRRWIQSGGLGTMGVGLPYAMGVKMAHPDSEVYCVTGEGSIQMCIQELSTVLQYSLPVNVVLLNNRYLGMVRQWQELLYQGRYSQTYMDALPNFAKLAEAYGHVGMLIERPQDVEPALREARKLKDRTVFMDFRTDPTANVFPMVPGGKGLTEMVLSAEALD